MKGQTDNIMVVQVLDIFGVHKSLGLIEKNQENALMQAM